MIIRLSIWDGSPVTLLVSDSDGYTNLCRLLTRVFQGGIAPINLITKQDLAQWSKGLICLAGGFGSRIRASLEKGQVDFARQALLELRELVAQPDRSQSRPARSVCKPKGIPGANPASREDRESS